jgi:hypothetical protein
MWMFQGRTSGGWTRSVEQSQPGTEPYWIGVACVWMWRRGNLAIKPYKTITFEPIEVTHKTQWDEHNQEPHKTQHIERNGPGPTEPKRKPNAFGPAT